MKLMKTKQNEKIPVKFLVWLFFEWLSPGVLVQCQAQEGAMVLLSQYSTSWYMVQEMNTT